MRLTFWIIIFWSSLTFSQKHYEFDYLVTYKSIYSDSSKKTTTQILSNSKVNSYFAVISEESDSEYKLKFTDHHGLHFNVFFNKNELLSADIINIKCEFVRKFDPKMNSKRKYYNYNIFSHVKNEDEYFADYKLQSINPRRAKRKKLGTYNYILSDSLNFYVPLTISHLEYEVWNSKNNVPNGLFKERIFTNHKGEVKHRYILEKVERIAKKIVIPSNCSL